MDRPTGRFAYATGLGILSAIQAAILSLPLSFWYAVSSASKHKSEFAGIAVFGTMLIGAALTAAIVLVIAFMVVLISYDPESSVYRRAIPALLASVAFGIAAIVVTAVFDIGAGWALALSALALVIGIIHVARQPG